MSTNESETVEDVINGRPVRLEIVEANILVGTRRYRMMAEGAKAFGVEKDDDFTAPDGVDADLFGLRVFTYPNLVAAVALSEGLEWPPTFDQFCQLPERFWNKWSAAVRRVNPHWYPSAEENASDPKASSTPTPSTSA